MTPPKDFLDPMTQDEPERVSPCAKIFDHKWLDPNCVENGCQSLVLQAAFSAAGKRAEEAERERDEFSADLFRLREATRVRPSKRAMKVVRETLEAMEAMDEEDAPALRLLVKMYDKLEANP